MVEFETLVIFGSVVYTLLMLVGYVYALYFGWRQSKVLDEMRSLNSKVLLILDELKEWRDENEA